MKQLKHFVCIFFFLFTFSLYAQEVFMGLIIRNNDQTIPLFLKSVSKLDYDKKLITLQINTFNKSHEVRDLLNEWILKNRHDYKEIVYIDNSAYISRMGENELIKTYAGIKDEYLVKTKMRQCDFCMIMASDVFLEPKTLKVLIQKNKPIISPMLRPIPEPFDLFRNFFGDVTEHGYYKDHSLYSPIANREKLGTFKVPCVHTVYLINAKYIDQLSFSDNFTYWDFISFSNNARKNQVKQYICNEKEFGSFLHFNKAMDLAEEKAFKLIGSDIEINAALLHKIMQPYYAEEPDLKTYGEDFNFNEYALYRVQNRDLFYVDDVNDYIKRYIIKKGAPWEEHIHERFKKYVRPGSVALDIGGHIGTHALNLSRLVGEHGQVHVFEPQRKMFCELAINMHINNCKNVVLHHKALGNDEKWVEMHIPKETWTERFSSNLVNEGHGTVKELTDTTGDKAKLIRLDDLKIDNISFIKIDVEGFEMEVIRGGLETIKRNVPVMVIEIFYSLERQNRIQEIENLGYQSVHIGGDDFLFIPIQLLGVMTSDPHDLSASRVAPKTEKSLKRNHFREKAISVAWEGSFVDCGSLSNVNRSITRPLSEYPDIKLTCVGPNGLTPKLTRIPELLEMSRKLHAEAPSHTDVTIRHAWPPNWQAPVKGKWIIIQPWEFGSLPQEWVDKIKGVDEVWAPSHFVKREYVESGVPAEKIYVVPNGINPSTFKPEGPKYPLATKKKFKFLFLGGTIWRKGPDLLLSSYLRTFRAADDVCLVIKDFGSKGCYAGQTHEVQIKQAQADPGNPEILYLDHEMSADEIASLYRACDCLVYPYRGEGFALPVLEAMASGIPVIVTTGGPTDDFVTKGCGWFIPSAVKSHGATLGDIPLVGEAWLLEPDTDILSGQMRWVASHPAEVRVKGEFASQHARQNWSWEEAASIAAERLRQIVH